MSCDVQACKFINGEVLIAEKSCDKSLNSIMGCGSSPTKYRKLGNVSAFQLFVESDVRGLTSKINFFDTPSCSTVVVNNVKVKIVLNSASVKNLRLALFGEDSSSNDSGSEEKKLCSSLESCDFIKLGCGITNLVVEVRNSSGTVSTLVNGTHYKADDFGFEMLVDYVLPVGQFFHAAYDYDDSGYSVTEGLMKAPKPQSLILKGSNMGKGSYNVEVFNIVFQPVASLDLISTSDFQSFELNGTVMRDCSKKGNLSQFFQIKESKYVGECG